MAKTKILFIVANDSKVLFPELYGADGSSACKRITGILTSARKFQQFQDLYCFVDLRLDATKISKMHYADLQGRLKEHAMKYLSSKSVAEYVFSRAGEHR